MTSAISVDRITAARIQIQNHHLDSPNGRKTFLENKLKLIAARAERLYEEIKEISKQVGIQQTKAVNDELMDKIQGRIALLSKLGVLTDIKNIVEDLKQVDTLLIKALPLTDAEEAILFRLEKICIAVDILLND